MRTEVIEKKKAEIDQHGRKADQIIALATREDKLNVTPEQIRAMHLANAEKYGNQPENAVAAARERRPVSYSTATRAEIADAGLAFAVKRLSERTTVMEDFELHRDALWFGRVTSPCSDVEAAFERNREKFIETQHWRSHAPAHRWTTPGMVEKETKILSWMRDGRETQGAIAGENECARNFVSKQMVRDDFAKYLAHLPADRNGKKKEATENQKHLVWGVIHSQDRLVGVQGLAGTGKSTSLAMIRMYAERYGYEVRGVAATSKATGKW